MNALRRKDRPWVLGLHVLGVVALTLALRERGGFEAFVVGAWRHEVLFHTAWVGGLVLGLVAACFDEALGTREYLRQRAVSPRQLLVARLQGIGSVLLGWLLLPPLFAWLLFVVFDDGWRFTRLDAFVRITISWTPAVSAAAIAFASASLPSVWWRRLLVLAALFFAGFGLVHDLSAVGRGDTSSPTFVAGHLLLAAFGIVVAFAAAPHTADADRPWPRSLRGLALGGAAVAVALMWATLVREPQVAVLRALHRSYPRAVRHGDEVVLARRREDADWQVATAGHEPTARVLPHGEVSASWRADAVWPEQWEIDAPRWLRQAQSVGKGDVGVVYLAADGAAWLRDWRDGAARVGKGDAAAAFGAASELGELGDAVVVRDGASNDLWRFDVARRCFVPLPFPGDDTLEAIDDVWLRPDDDLDLRRSLGIDDDRSYHSLGYVRGARRGYVVRDGALVAIEGLRVRGRAGLGAAADDGAPCDPIACTVEVSATDGGAPFRHEFTPRTASERFYAGGAMLWSVLRPPALQAVAHLRAADERPACWFDPLVQGGRRTWLVLAGFGFAVFLSWRTARRLRRLGAPGPVVRFWSLTTLLFGPIAAALAVVFERPRAYADRALPGPVPAPRIVTVTAIEEPVA